MNNWISPIVKQLWNYTMHQLHNFLGFKINTTAFCFLLLKSSMTSSLQEMVSRCSHRSVCLVITIQVYLIFLCVLLHVPTRSLWLNNFLAKNIFRFLFLFCAFLLLEWPRFVLMKAVAKYPQDFISSTLIPFQSMFLSVFLSIFLSVYLSMPLSEVLSIFLSDSLSDYVSICNVSIYLPMFLFVYVPIYLCFYLFMCPSNYVSILYNFLFFFVSVFIT